MIIFAREASQNFQYPWQEGVSEYIESVYLVD